MKENIVEQSTFHDFKCTKLGKKTILNQKKDSLIKTGEKKLNKEEISEKIIIIGDNNNNFINQKDNKASFLLKLIIKSFYLSLWKKQVKKLKYYSRVYNPKRANFKKLINKLSSIDKSSTELLLL